jgi:hypothetical protein
MVTELSDLAQPPVILFEVQSNPLITTSVYATPRLQRQIFRGSN